MARLPRPSPEEQYRIWIYQMLARMEADPALGERAKADPVGTLTEAGIPLAAIEELLGAAAEFESDFPPACGDTTCWVSLCNATCFVTVECQNPETLPPVPRREST
jgi:hypothetical protein